MEWISVDIRLPKDGEHCLVVKKNAPKEYITIATYHEREIDESNWIGSGFAMYPTHWMPLPEPPKQ